MHNLTNRGVLLIMLAAVAWGTVGVTTKTLYAMSAATPLSIGFFRLAFAVPALLVGGWLVCGRSMFCIAGRDVWRMLLMGAMTALYQVCYFAAIKRVGVAVATLITLCSAPVMVAGLSTWLTGERLTWRLLRALAGALGGTVLLIDVQALPDSTGPDLYGISLALGSALGYASITLVSGVLARRYHPLQPVAIGFSCGAVLLWLAHLGTGCVGQYPLQGWLLLAYLGLVPTALAYGIFLTGMRYTSAPSASVITLLEPCTAAMLAWWLYDERMSPLQGVGILLLSSAMLALYRGSKTA
jgi:DME family drug/metabolite transporter